MQLTSNTVPDGLANYWVVCLCAEWCGSCRDYRAVFSKVATHYPQVRFVWLDIEDQADLLGDLEFETFPTLLVADARGMKFFGPLTPHAATLSRLLRALHEPDAHPRAHLPATLQLISRLPRFPELRLDRSIAAL